MKPLASFIIFFLFPLSLIAQECTEGNCVNGEGTYVYSDGTKYTGEFENSEADGFGVCYYANGNVYTGQFKDHKTSGYGAWAYPDGRKQNGYYDINGNFVDATALTKGCFSGNCENGYGTYYYDNGTIYIGNFQNGQCHGQGTCYFEDGSMYVGQWAKHMFNGQGVHYTTSGVIERGFFQDHKFVGEESGGEVGCISGNCIDGFGIYKYDDGGIYTGEFVDSYREGQGTYYWKDGGKYVGAWVLGQFEGEGTYTYPDGTVSSGTWKNHELVSSVEEKNLKAEIRWEDPLTATTKVTYNNYNVKACIQSASDVAGIKVFNNGQEVFSKSQFEKDALSGCTISFSEIVYLNPGINKIEIQVRNNGGVAISVERQIELVVANQQKRLALVLGNAEYQYANKLRNPTNDAQAMSRMLQNLGFTVIERENASLRDMKMAIDEFGKKLNDEKYDVALFYYAGHGIQVKGLNYLVPVEADISSEAQVEYDCLRADRVKSFMDVAGADVNIIILDACRNNPFARSWSRSGDAGGLAFMSAPTGTLIAYATAPGHTAADGEGQNGLYTESLLMEMTNPSISILQVFQRVRNRVSQRSGQQQIPWESTSLTGDFYMGKK